MASQREQVIVLNNATGLFRLKLTQNPLAHGHWWNDDSDKPLDTINGMKAQWFNEPPSVINPGDIVAWGAQSGGFMTGTQGGAWYHIERKDPNDPNSAGIMHSSQTLL